jgi:hypothetical protein
VPEVCKRFPELPQSTSELFRIKTDSFLAIATGDLVITIEPTERLMELVTALRTRKDKGNISEERVEVRQFS